MIRLAFLFLGCSALAGLAQAQPGDSRDWATYRNDRFGLFLRYPADVLYPERASEAGDGQVFVSRDGDARLLVGALLIHYRMLPRRCGEARRTREKLRIMFLRLLNLRRQQREMDEVISPRSDCLRAAS